MGNNLISSEDEEDGDDDPEPETRQFYTQNGRKINQNTVTEVTEILDEILDEANKFSREQSPIADETETIGSFAHRRFREVESQRKRIDSETQHDWDTLLNWRLLSEKTENACKSAYELSLFAWGEYKECPGALETELKPNKGFISIINAIKLGVPSDCIQLGCPVRVIYWDPSISMPFTKGIRTKMLVKNDDAQHSQSQAAPAKKLSSSTPIQLITGTGQIIKAEHVIVTSSLGYLKRNAHKMFKPLLPNDKMAAIQSMGFGVVDKIYLEFEVPFWDKDIDGICLAWENEETFILQKIDNKEYEEHIASEWFRGIQGFSTVAGQPNILVGWIAGDEAELMENVPDTIVKYVCQELLQRFLGDESIPEPKAVTRSSWHKDKYACGSYSYIRAGSTASLCESLAMPLTVNEVPRVLFAGEATHKEYFSTSHGALLSGQREADRIINFHQSNQ